MKEGYIYILRNPAFEYLKIGQTSRSPDERAAELSRETGVPMAFTVAYKVKVEDCLSAEKEIQKKLHQFRIRGKEFFDIPLTEAIEIVAAISKKYQRATPEKEASERRQKKEELSSGQSRAMIIWFFFLGLLLFAGMGEWVAAILGFEEGTAGTISAIVYPNVAKKALEMCV